MIRQHHFILSDPLQPGSVYPFSETLLSHPSDKQIPLCAYLSIQLFHASAGNSAKYFPRGAGTDLTGYARGEAEGNSSQVGTCTEGKCFALLSV